ncbi:ABC-2 type transport system permease protein [Streptacidiphilus sp. MAP12-16]|uniref:ABC transporter permease n=1 Tax=Streptacidiphilus sp. MAP12-16 TaxID=3156300 RepID=UPI003515DF4A
MSTPLDTGAVVASGKTPTSTARTLAGRRLTLCDAIHAEWTKFRTVAGMLWLVAAAALLTIGLGVAVDSSVTCPTTGCDVDTVKTSFTGIMLGQAIVAMLAVLAIGTEYSSGVIRTSLTATPQRLTGYIAKIIVVGAVTLAVAIVSVTGSLIAGRLILPTKGFTAANGSALPSLTDGTVLRATLCAVLYLFLIALLSLGIAYVARESTAAIGIVLGLLYLFPIVAQVISNETWHKRLERLGPMTAGLAAQTTKNIAAQPITPWHGIGVVALWALGALLAGGTVLRMKDA